MCNGNETGEPTPALLSGKTRVKRGVSTCPPQAGIHSLVPKFQLGNASVPEALLHFFQKSSFLTQSRADVIFFLLATFVMVSLVRNQGIRVNSFSSATGVHQEREAAITV